MQQCEPGNELSPSGGECIPCTSNQVSDGSEPCHFCGDGYEPTENFGKCRRCSAGFFSSEGKPCQQCANGSSALYPGSKVCTLCAKNEFSSNFIACTICTDGQGPNSFKTGCEDCPVGQYSNISSNSTCELCPAGTYSTKTGAEKCETICTSGTFSPGGSTPCKNCPIGTYSEADQMGECKKCPENYFSSKEGATKCQPCEIGKFSAEGSAQCSSPKKTSSKMSGGAIAGITVGVVVIIVVILIVLGVRLCKKEPPDDSDECEPSEYSGDQFKEWQQEFETHDWYPGDDFPIRFQNNQPQAPYRSTNIRKTQTRYPHSFSDVEETSY